MTDADRAFIIEHFERCRPFIQAALDRDLGTHTADDVLELLLTGPVQIWPTANAVMITVVETYPRKKLLRGWLSGGALSEIQKSEPAIRAWAEKQGCDLIIIAGRKGWLRAFEGYDEVVTVIAREI